MDSSEIFDIANDKDFKRKCLEVFHHQAEFNSVYREFIELLGRSPRDVRDVEDIPFLPIEFFKTRRVLSTQEKVVKTFTSSGTTGSVPSRHMVTDLSLYEQSFTRGFEHFYGSPEKYSILALLPSYLERGGSSLVYMAGSLIQMSRSDASGFYLDELGDLAQILEDLDRSEKRVLLLGVSYALLDLVQLKNFNLDHTIVMETGGMKGRRKEMVREELHNVLKKGFGVDRIHSEYGMTELLSQAYSKGNGLFRCPPWMKILIRDTEDPFHYLGFKKSGGVNIIDLANLNSCSFIATQDLGRAHRDGSFEIVGRFDHSDIRGCNLMAV